MQAPGGSADGGMGSSEGRGGQRSLGDPACRVTSGGTEGKGGHSTLNPVSEPGNRAGPAGASGQDARSGPDDQGSPGVAAAAAVAAVAPPRGDPAPQAAGPSGDTAVPAGGPGSRPLEMTLTAPFRSPLEADMARRSLDPAATCHQGVILEEFAVKGSDLTVWTAKDPVLFQICISSFLDRLSLVIRNIRHLASLTLPKQGRGKGPQF